MAVNRAVPKTCPKSNTWHGGVKLFIANLPYDATQEEVLEYFKARHPEGITDVLLIHEKNRDGTLKDHTKGYGFVYVSSEAMADQMVIQYAQHYCLSVCNEASSRITRYQVQIIRITISHFYHHYLMMKLMQYRYEHGN